MLLRLLAPPLCAGCGGDAGGAEPLCAWCRGELRWLGPEPVELAGVRVWAPLAYEGPARGVVRALKFGGARRAAAAMAAQIVANAPPGWLDAGSAALGASDAPGGFAPPALGAAARPGSPQARLPELVPVPLHPSRARKRGYNQARLLADAIAARTGLPVTDCLERAGPRGTQVGRDRAQRLAGIAGTITVRRSDARHFDHACDGRSAPCENRVAVPAVAILVDDVITTGATLAACAGALGTDVRAVAYARTPGR
jgi:predicted amidophosphoribosyltransferase